MSYIVSPLYGRRLTEPAEKRTSRERGGASLSADNKSGQ